MANVLSLRHETLDTAIYMEITMPIAAVQNAFDQAISMAPSIDRTECLTKSLVISPTSLALNEG